MSDAPAPTTRASLGRRFDLLQLIRGQGRLEVSAAVRLLGVSAETVRRDLRALESQGLISRTYGTALALESGAFETSLEERAEIGPEEKTRLAAAAVARLGEAQIVFLDEGFTMQLLAQRMPDDRRLTVVTASLPIATLLARRPNVQVIMLGGRVRGNTLGVVDNWAADLLGRLTIDLAFIGANGVSVERGLTTPDPAVALVKSAAVRASVRRVFVAAHHKFGHATFVRFADLGDFETVLTGHELAATQAATLVNAGVPLVRV